MINNRFTDQAEEDEFYGREALKELKQLYPEYFKYDLQFTTSKYDDYDCYWFVINEQQQIVKRIWVEIKVRSYVYDEYILEPKKLEQLIKKRDSLYLTEKDVTFLYINFMPDQTVVWNITNVNTNNTQNLMANKATCDSRTDKINKKVIMLKPEDGKQLDYILNKRLLLLKYDQNYLIDKVKKETKRRPGLEDILFS